MTEAIQKHWKSGLPVIGVVAALLVLFFFDPNRHAFYPRCPFHSLTGWHCPGCGALRGLHELLHGHLLAAIRMNLLVFLGLPLFGAAYLYQRLRNKDGAHATVFQHPLLGWVALAIVILFWILRNIPFHPFTLLAP